MENQDYLKRQIDQLGRALAEIFSVLTGSKNNGQGVELNFVNQIFEDELGLEISDSLDIPTDKFIDMLVNQKNLSIDNLNKFAEILLLIAKIRQDDTNILFEKCLVIYEYLEKAEDVYSLERQWKIKQIKKALINL